MQGIETIGSTGIGWRTYDLYVTHNNSRGSLDNAPAGWYHTQQEIAYEIDPTNPKSIDYWTIYNLEHVSSFIPTASSLGFINPDFNWHEDFDRSLICPTNPEIPFDNYYGADKNTRHTSFTKESFAWFLEELNGDTVYPAPTVYLDDSNIHGPGLVCYGKQETYFIDACTVSVDWWNVSPNLTVVSSDENSITVEPAPGNNNNGEGFVTAHFAHDWAKKTFWVETPDKKNIQTIPSGTTQVGSGTSTTFNADSIEPGLQYVWRINYNGKTAGPGEVLPKFPSNYQNVTTGPQSKYVKYIATSYQISVNWGNVPGMYTVSCAILNECGEGAWDVVMVTVLDPGDDPCDEIGLLISPNPVENELQVEVTLPNTEGLEAPWPPCLEDPNYYGDPVNTLVEIYDLSGNERYSENFETLQFTITNPNLETGSYIFIATTSNGKIGREIIIVE